MSYNQTTGSPITINTVTVKKGKDPTKDSANLMRCYFEELEDHPNEYRFYSTEDNHIPTSPENLISGTDFRFIRAGMLWEVTEFNIGQGAASGNWANPRGEKGGDDDGSFQAQSGAGADSSAATA